MLCGCLGVLLIIILIIAFVLVYYKNYKNSNNSNNSKSNSNNTIEPFLFIDDSNLYMPPTDKELPTEIQYQIPSPGNNLTDLQSQAIDSDILRNVRVLTNFSKIDELDFYQMYNIIKQMKTDKYTINYDPSSVTKKSNIISSEKLISLNSGAINKTDLELFTTIKLELISAFNNLIIKTGYYTPYHPYQFFKIINSNMISQSVSNYVFTLTIAREYKFQQFVIYYDLDLIQNTDTNNTNSNEYYININKIELIGIPIPKTIEFHENKKTTDKEDINSSTKPTQSTFESLLKTYYDNHLSNEELEHIDLSNIDTNRNSDIISLNSSTTDNIYKDQVSDSTLFDVMPIGDKSKTFQNPNMKFIDLTERSDMDPTFFDQGSLSSKVEDRIMNVARDKQYTNHRCFGLVNGVSQELPQYKNPIFCTSFHPEIGQNGIWDAPCQINSDCPFYKVNKNYPNEFGKCNKETGQCEMPLGIIPIGYTKYGRLEPDCYNCESIDINYLINNNYDGGGGNNDKCCGKQDEEIKSGKVNYKSPDYVFKDDEIYRRQFAEDLLSVGLNVNPSI
jgi:hypothetical protein